MRTIVFLLTITFALGCVKEDDFLTEEPKDAIFAENVYTNHTGFMFAQNAVFSLMRMERAEGGIGTGVSAELSALLWKVGTDNAYATWSLSWLNPFGRYNTGLNPQAVVIEGAFLHYYQIINASNMIISRAANNEVDWGGATAEDNELRKQEIIANARFTRAWAYRLLVFGWGAVPLSTDEINGLNYRNDWDRTPAAEVKRFIIDEFLAAEPFLADQSSDVQKIPKVAVQHYLAEMFLSLYNDDNGNTQALDSALLYANKVVSNTTYQLITQRYGVHANEPGVAFMDQFKHGNVQPQQGNTEVLWWFPNKDVLDFYGTYKNSMKRTWMLNYPDQWGLPVNPENGGRGVSRCAILPEAFALYEEGDERFSNHAIRKYYLRYHADGSFRDTIWTVMGDPADFGQNDNSRASTRKWDWMFDEPTLWTQTNLYNDQPYLRLAETYLLYAEILLYKGDMQGAASWINKVRERAKASIISPSEVTVDFILDERSRELITEEYRKITLLRTGKLIERALKFNPQVKLPSSPPGLQDYHVLYPIPQSVIDANNGKPMAQNPGY